MKTILEVKGMHCSSCKVLIEDVLGEMKEIVSCDADVRMGKVEIEHEIRLNLEKIKRELKTLNNYIVISSTVKP